MLGLFKDFQPLAYIFDFDGTIADTMSVWNQVGADFVARYDLADCQKDVLDALFLMGLDEFGVYIKRRYGTTDRAEEITQTIIDSTLALYGDNIRLKPGVKRFLAGLVEQEIPVALATSSPQVLIDLALEQHDLACLFSTLCFCEDVAASKEFPDIYLEAARRLGVSITDCVVFEDAPGAMRTAKGTGAHLVAVVEEAAGQDITEMQALADYVLYDYRDLL